MNQEQQSLELTDEQVEAKIRRLSRRALLMGGIVVAAGYGGLRWLNSQPKADGIGEAFRKTLEFNERVGRATFNKARLAPEFPRNMAMDPRANGTEGLESALELENYVIKVEGAQKPVEVTLEQLKKLPRVEMTTEMKCVEGWSQIVHWAGYRLADFIAAYAPVAGAEYVGLETPDGGYYVGLEMESATHPQTLLCTEMNGEPLAEEHGAPVRLTIPLKYGIKAIKRIGVIRYAKEKPKDYWAEQGYDWYAGH